MKKAADIAAAEHTSSRGARRLASLLALGALLALAFAAAPAQAVEQHILDPALTLRGDCATNALDEIPDPGLCPGVAGVDHPPKAFERPCGVTTDRHGYIYVASPDFGLTGNGTEGRIDIFDPEGKYITEIENENNPCGLAVDSEGNLYVNQLKGFGVAVYEPDSFPPTPTTDFGSATLVYDGSGQCAAASGLGVDPSNDHLYTSRGCHSVTEYGSAVEGWPLLNADIGGKFAGVYFGGVDVYGKTHDVYVSGVKPNLANGGGGPEHQRIFIFDGIDGHKKCEIDGTETPAGSFSFTFAKGGVTVDQSNGDVYVADAEKNNVAVQFDAECNFIAELPKPPKLEHVDPYPAIAIDTPMLAGEAGYESPNEGHLFVTSGLTAAKSRLWSFAPVEPPKAPEIEGQTVFGITETEAILAASVNPNGIATSYRFEYVTQAEFEASGYAGAISTPAPDGNAGAGIAPKALSAAVSGLAPDTAYRFRLVAANHCLEAEPEALCTTLGEGKPGEEGEDVAFSTYLPEAGPAAGRAYELVTPPDTNGRLPNLGELAHASPSNFDTALITADGQSVLFGVQGGSLPGIGGGGVNDTYLAERGSGGWQSRFNGLSAAEAELPRSGGVSSDHRYAFWRAATARGSLAVGNYLRDPGGDVEPIGIGSLGEVLDASGHWIAPDGEHVVFSSFHRLEEAAPSEGVAAVYERSADGSTEVVSLLPGGATPAGSAAYQGISRDGSTIAFRIDSTLYLRQSGETHEVAVGNPVLGGISNDGERLVYLQDDGAPDNNDAPRRGEIFLYDDASETSTQIGSGNESAIVNVSPDGSHVYFLSPKQLDGIKGEAGKQNLYLWDVGSEAVRFIATVTERDAIGEPAKGISTTMTNGLGLWVNAAVNPNRSEFNGPGAAPSRSSEDGSVLIFESRADLTGYDSGERAEVYRFDANAKPGSELACLSCVPTGLAPQSDALLQFPFGGETTFFPPTNLLAELVNLTEDGKRAVFQSADRLVVGDIDGKIDVYEWLAQGTGGCKRAEGCVHLISFGRSADDDYLYAMTPDASTVVFESGDLLVPEDLDTTPSLYAARIGGGYPSAPPPSGECLGEACQPSVVAPGDPDSVIEDEGNPPPSGKSRCPKGKRKVRRAGKTRCVKRNVKRSHKKHKRTDADRRAQR